MRSSLSTAREKVAALRDALLQPSPEAIEACLPGLVEAAALLRGASPESLTEFRAELHSIKDLIEHGEKLNQGLARILGARLAGYMPTGDAAPIFATGTLSVEG